MTNTASRQTLIVRRTRAANVALAPRWIGSACTAVSLLWLSWCTSPTAAITINLIPAPDNMTDHPGFDTDLSKLAPIVQAAADYWESILRDNHQIDIYFRYLDLDPGVWGISHVLDDNGQRPTEGLVSFDTIINTGVPHERDWYFDPTPFNNSEFEMHQVLVRELEPQQQSMYYNGSPPAFSRLAFGGTTPAPNSATICSRPRCRVLGYSRRD